MRKQAYRPPPEYSIWVMMKQRCYNVACKSYKNYGGRGIDVCPEWRESYKAFIADMGPRPDKQYTLERKDNSKGYYKDNCVWATRREQSLNKRDNRIITIDGISKTMQEWAEEKGIHQATLSY